MNQPEMVSLKETRDAAMRSSEEYHPESSEPQIKTLYDAAVLLRHCINKSKEWDFTGSLDNITDEQLPKELYSFFRWVIQGPKATLNAEEKSLEVHKRAVSLSQSTISMTLSERQAQNKKSEILKVTKEMPQQLAVGLAVHQAFRCKEIVNMLHGFGMSVEYNRLLRVEAQIEKSVLQRIEQNGGVYLPPDIVIGRHVFFAIDNVDFAEDTYDGKRTLHGAAMAIYQKRDPGDVEPDLRFESTANVDRTIKDLPESFTTLLECQKPPSNPNSPVYPSFGLFAENELPITVQLDDFAWLLARNLTRTAVEERPRQTEEDDTQSNLEGEPVMCSDVPVWSGYNSLLLDNMPITRIGSPPLIAAPVHEWNTLLTTLMQAQAITTKVMGPERKTVISLDMGLYQPAKKLQMARNDLNHLVLRPGELHVVMAQLRTIGAFIEDSGIDLCWIESELYGPSTVKQIIDGNHVKRGEVAHMVTLQALFTMYQRSFFSQQEPQMNQHLETAAKELGDACTKGTKDDIEKAHNKMVKVMESLDVAGKMKAFDVAHHQIPEFQVFCHYMRMVMEMMLFIRAVRTGNWHLHLTALQLFTKYFFAHDRLNYARMIPLYLAEMHHLKDSDPEIYQEFLNGNWVVNKNRHAPFCALGADHALEHINRSMKVSGGLVGITLNPSARAKFFLIAPELARLAEEAKDMAGSSSTMKGSHHHHALTVSVLCREEKSIEQLLTTMESFTNPFTQNSSDLFNLVTKVVMPEKVKNDLCKQSEIGQNLYQRFVKDRIQSGKFNLWSPMKKQKLQTWKTMGKKVKVRADNDIVVLREDRNLFARMMVVCKSRPEIDIQEAIGTYEFSVVPRSMFAADGTMLRCSCKSALMNILEKLPVNANDDNSSSVTQNAESVEERMRVSILDAMAEVQSLDKPEWIRNCSQLADHFTSRIFGKHSESEEIRLVFDRYDIPSSLKEATRVKSQGGQNPVYYHITASTHIAKVPMKKLLSHTKTKKELTEYLAQKTIECAERNGRRVVVAWGCECKGTNRDMSYLNSNQEEADTKIILHALDATANGATELRIHSPDTDVFILSLRRYPDLCKNTVFITGTRQNYREIKLQPIVHALGPSKTAALPAFHALSGADNTGCFYGKGKVACWNAFMEADEYIICALSSLGTSDNPSSETVDAIEKLVCKLYLPKTGISSVKVLRWWLFTKKQAQSERLPPTQAALIQAIRRSHYQLLVWNSDKVANPSLPAPDNFGWTAGENEWAPVMTNLPPASDAIIHLIKCKCAKERCSTNRCQCRKAGLNCTDLCGCSDSDNLCENTLENIDDDSDIDDECDSDSS
ncbi:hypothetical protein QZH41_004431 [Actinostola sp. cb2023]|nr:hypothetical protein QZH41_004431 [Actinostola sp. cb2023]